MKKLGVNTLVPDRMHYYVLDWKDRDTSNYLMLNFNKVSISLLTKEEFVKLFNHAMKQDIKSLENNQNG